MRECERESESKSKRAREQESARASESERASESRREQERAGESENERESVRARARAREIFLQKRPRFCKRDLYVKGASINMGWHRFLGSLNCHVSFAKEPYKNRALLQKRP